MKRLLLTLSLIVLAFPALHAQSLTSEERAKANNYLKKTRDEFLAATKGLSKAQWDFKPATNRWSVAQVSEHIAASEDFIRAMVTDKVMTAPPRSETEDLHAIDEMVLQRIPDRSQKAQAPEPLQPGNRFGSPKESLKHFKTERAKTVAFLKQTKDLRQHALESPLGKKLDGYQWVLFIAAHSERHTKQILEVKADPAFPKK